MIMTYKICNPTFIKEIELFLCYAKVFIEPENRVAKLHKNIILIKIEIIIKCKRNRCAPLQTIDHFRIIKKLIQIYFIDKTKTCNNMVNGIEQRSFNILSNKYMYKEFRAIKLAKLKTNEQNFVSKKA